MGVVSLVRRLNASVAHALAHWSLRVRLLLFYGVAGCTAIVLAAAGLWGLSRSNDSLQAVYAQRMLPVQQLAEIQRLMLVNRLLLETSLAGVDTLHQHPPEQARWARSAADTASAIEANIGAINTLWRRYATPGLNAPERALADRFAYLRGAYVTDTLFPAAYSGERDR
ncbi:MAG: Tar ligand binding domain-containing protein [Rhodoferax sp.]